MHGACKTRQAAADLRSSIGYRCVSALFVCLQRVHVAAGTFQLLMGTDDFMMPSRKSEELTPPTLKDFVYITDKTYTIQQLVQMENLVLKRLDFNLMAPTTIQFLCLYIAIHSICANTQYLAMVSKVTSIMSSCWSWPLRPLPWHFLFFYFPLVSCRVESARNGSFP